MTRGWQQWAGPATTPRDCGLPYHNRYPKLTEIVTKPITGGGPIKAPARYRYDSLLCDPLPAIGRGVREVGSCTWRYLG